MIETKSDSPAKSATDIRIVGLNTDKTRRMIGSEVVYQIYLELSGLPPQGWINIFEHEWEASNVGQPLSLQETSVERAFLVVHCPLQEVGGYMPVLKKTVALTNILYDQYALKQANELKDREDVWKNERKTVEDMAKSLHFD